MPRRSPINQRWPFRPAMTLVEMAIVLCVVSAAVYLLVGWTGQLQQRAKRDLAVRLLSDLDKALWRYSRATGSYPPSYGPDSAISATVCFLDHDRTRPIMEALPDSLWRGPGRRTLVDPWGTQLQYHDAKSRSPLVKANGGRPVFVSAGPDRDFGEANAAGKGDNLRSDDPGPDGFRLHDSLRESMEEEGAAGGKKGN